MVALKLTDIPIELQSLILDKLSDPPHSSFLEDAGSNDCKIDISCEELRDDVLHAAQASSSLTKAAIFALGPRRLYLSFFKTKWLWEWIPIVKDYVKGIELAGADVWNYCQGQCEQKPCQCDHEEEAMLEALKSLHSNEVKLEELDMEALELFNPNRAEEIAHYMLKALQRSSSTLRMIGLKGNKASVKAMKSVTLPNLETVHLSAEIFVANDDDDYRTLQVSNIPRSEIAICQILKAINANAGQVASTSTVRELKLHLASHVPIIKFETCPQVFLGVKKLVLTFNPAYDNGNIAKFISHFRNLESLCWYKGSSKLRVQDMKAIFKACPYLKGLSFGDSDGYIRREGNGIPENTSRLKNLFLSFRGQLQSVTFGYLTSDQINVLGETSPKLRIVYMDVDEASVGALPLLLGNHCRQLSELRLKYSLYSSDCLGRDGWTALSNAVSSASPHFRTVSLICNKNGRILERAIEDMVDAICSILQCMGDRAITVVFGFPMVSTSALVVLKGLYRTLKSAVVYCKSIKNVCLDFLQLYPNERLSQNEEEDEINHCYKAVCKLRDIISASANLEEVDIGKIEALLQRAS